MFVESIQHHSHTAIFPPRHLLSFEQAFFVSIHHISFIDAFRQFYNIDIPGTGKLFVIRRIFSINYQEFICIGA